MTFPDDSSLILFITENGSVKQLDIPIPLPAIFACQLCSFFTHEHRQLKHHWKQSCVEALVDFKFICQSCSEAFDSVKDANKHYTGHGTSEPVHECKLKSLLSAFKFRPEDAAGLEPSGWLSDRVIDLALADLCVRFSSSRKAYAFSTLFLQDLDKYGEGDPLTTSASQLFNGWVFSTDIIFFPVNHNNAHWSLVIIDLKQKSFVHFDSLSSDASTARAKAVCRTLSEFTKVRLGDTRFDTFVFDESRSCSRQNDAVNCGVHVLLNASSYIGTGTVGPVSAAD